METRTKRSDQRLIKVGIPFQRGYPATQRKRAQRETQNISRIPHTHIQNNARTRLAAFEDVFWSIAITLFRRQQQKQQQQYSNDRRNQNKQHKTSSEYFSQILFSAYIAIYTTLTYTKRERNTRANTQRNTLTPAYKHNRNNEANSKTKKKHV